MTSKRAVLPALPPPSFPPVSMLPANRLIGATLVLPETGLSTGGELEGSVLERQSSVVGNVLCVDDKHYFWMQRKIRSTSTHGSLRVGFCLKNPVDQKQGSMQNRAWEVVVALDDNTDALDGTKTNEQRVQMVAIRVEGMSDIVDSPELAVLQYISSFYNDQSERSEHVPNSMLVAADSSQVYIVMPYDYVVSLSLFDYCLSQPGSIVPEADAREIFCQILQGLESLQTMGLCHRQLSLDNVVLRKVVRSSVSQENKSHKFDYCCTIREFGCASRVPCSADGGVVHMLKPLPLMSSCNVQYVAPEVWNGGVSDENECGPRPFDAFAADLWSVGVILLAMMFGTDRIFVAPVPEDRVFKHICMDGHIKEFATHCPTRSSDNVLDLLHRLLLCDPKDRPTLAEVQKHPWVVGG